MLKQEIENKRIKHIYPNWAPTSLSAHCCFHSAQPNSHQPGLTRWTHRSGKRVVRALSDLSLDCGARWQPLIARTSGSSLTTGTHWSVRYHAHRPRIGRRSAGLCGWGHRVSVAIVIFPRRSRLRGARDTDANRGGCCGARAQSPVSLSAELTPLFSLPLGPRRWASPLPSPLSSDGLNSRRAARESWATTASAETESCMEPSGAGTPTYKMSTPDPWLSPIRTPPPDITARGEKSRPPQLTTDADNPWN
jgi:hypothetical protein